MQRRTHRFRKALIGTAAIALVATPVALAAPIDGADRNPSTAGTPNYTRETQIIGNIAQNQGGHAAGTGGFVTRQSNHSSSGGGAIYRCRALAGTEACVAANNLANGDAFRFQASETAASIGQLRFGLNISKLVAKPPFVTNATGLVKNLNADRLDDKSAEDFVEKGSLLFAAVAADGTIGANRGVPSGSTGTPSSDADGNRVYAIPFSGDLSKCVATANPTQVVAGETISPLVVSIGTTANAVTPVTVIEQQSADSPYGFALQVTC